MGDTTGFWNTLLGGLLGQGSPDMSASPPPNGMPGVEAPSPLVSIGRGFMDDWEPLKQTYLNYTDPVQAQAYLAQRAENERLYQRGLLAANPNAGTLATTPGGAPIQVAPSDFWRMIGRTAPGGAVTPWLPATAAEATMSAGLTASVWDAIQAAQRKFGLLPSVEFPNMFR